MTNEEMMQIAMAQSAEDMGCKAEDFTKTENVLCQFKLGKNAKKYYSEPIVGNFVSYGNNVVAAVQDDIKDIVEEYMNKFEFYHLFEMPNMDWLNDKIRPLGYGVCYMAEYYLPRLELLNEKPSDLEFKVLEQKDFSGLYLPEWSNALCEARKELDVLGVGAYKDGELIGFAACSADADEMWQIGIDVLPAYRRKGIASATTGRLIKEILKRDKVPFYCTAWSNIRSVGNAIKCGFIPTWVEMTIKPLSVIEEINK
ncbi:Acetyltransferase (GNAT) family protein [Eubacterium ruminantium]|uniref:Acetyltransferase (GNAT) family protein n=1 Tax=Eubacterium ruminantium TaxID=42322 RepID=A0A1T4NX54_9FIRM|nr:MULTISPECIES: GNAT family N-acetyltransferase [Eubacterium]MCR5367540.1 GNAT family N-acetyltransferase [Eubacterium sp.]SCW56113.1 Acetyltransferase (GNAT) family protein [Eubacterium ruminantium]SDN04833.1 Acetyltransferase (GNAT) family protein [Eubacterium ruminantium]SJZ83626.1 Acetyltransferase (GNAT) family protein [Eubacterium ruminantium]